MRGKIISFFCGVLITLLVVVGCLHIRPLLPKNSSNGLYDYAVNMADEDMFVCGDGTLWRFVEYKDDLLKLVFTGEYAEGLDLAVNKSSADDMSIDEFMIAIYDDKGIFIRQNGEVYMRWGVMSNADGRMYEKLDKESDIEQYCTVLPVEPREEYYNKELRSDFMIGSPEVLDIETHGRGDYIWFTVTNNSGDLFPSMTIVLFAYVDGGWFEVPQSRSGTAELTFMGPGEEKFGAWCRAGYSNDFDLPSGRYRAELYSGYPSIRALNRLDPFAAVEFELVCTNGEYSVK